MNMKLLVVLVSALGMLALAQAAGEMMPYGRGEYKSRAAYYGRRDDGGSPYMKKQSGSYGRDDGDDDDDDDDRREYGMRDGGYEKKRGEERSYAKPRPYGSEKPRQRPSKYDDMMGKYDDKYKSSSTRYDRYNGERRREPYRRGEKKPSSSRSRYDDRSEYGGIEKSYGYGRDESKLLPAYETGKPYEVKLDRYETEREYREKNRRYGDRYDRDGDGYMDDDDDDDDDGGYRGNGKVDDTFPRSFAYGLPENKYPDTYRFKCFYNGKTQYNCNPYRLVEADYKRNGDNKANAYVGRL